MVFGCFAICLLPICYIVGLAIDNMVTSEKQLEYEQAEKVTVAVPVLALYKVEDEQEGGVTCYIKIMHPHTYALHSFYVEHWEYEQLELGAEVQLTYPLQGPKQCRLSCGLSRMLTPIYPPIEAFEHPPTETMKKALHYYEKKPPFWKALGLAHTENDAEFLDTAVLIGFFLFPFILALAVSWWTLAALPLLWGAHYLLDNWLTERQKKAFDRMEKTTAHVAICGKHRGKDTTNEDINTKHFVVLHHPETLEALTFLVHWRLYEQVAIGEKVAFVYSPEHPGQYYIHHIL